MALSGGMVAGLRAGLAYNTFPLMNGRLVPPEILQLEPWWRNFLYNMATVQFVHRAIAFLLLVLVVLFWWRALAAPLGPRQRLACHLLVATLLLQVALGIATLLLVVPVALAAAHQAGAVLLLAASLWAAHELR
jgi:cytochrome c oxidase assembly protein subunit 15